MKQCLFSARGATEGSTNVMTASRTELPDDRPLTARDLDLLHRPRW